VIGVWALVPGGLLVTSYTTRFTPRTSLTIRVATRVGASRGSVPSGARIAHHTDTKHNVLHNVLDNTGVNLAQCNFYRLFLIVNRTPR